MADFVMNDYLLWEECKEIAKDIFTEHCEEMAPDEEPDTDAMMDRAHEWADGHSWVIYTHKALKLCVYCNTDRGEQFLAGVGMPDEPTFAGLATFIAYGEMRGRIEEELQELIEEWEPSEEPSEE
ncbi:MAG: hypothetical protein AAF808_03255, partial [Cyanobacteria bacterium P01_D01_bin.2]